MPTFLQKLSDLPTRTALRALFSLGGIGIRAFENQLVRRHPKERARWGRLIVDFDRRPGVGLRHDGLPDLAWCEVPAGVFIMGGDNAWKHPDAPRESAQKYELPTFYIARYPVTYAQFEAFQRSDGYANRAYWTEEGWEWKGRKMEPKFHWNDPKWHIANHPVVGVTWYEAYAFTQWLSVKLNYAVRLPTEAEWEKAARGPLGQYFPFGNEFDFNKCNTARTGIDRTTAVGLFPDGGTPYSEPAYDMSGNVQEWCLSESRSGPYEHRLAEQISPEGSSLRVLRGGSWYDIEDGVRAAAKRGEMPHCPWSTHGADAYGFRVVCSHPPSRTNH